ncbi:MULTISPECIES: ATP-binding protein [Halocynthiibacter]|uniref:histidine kinase n=1 Tax=Halocynthiibacter halioticoli TaxID=2986804 RepID=A0AAE3J3B9_9RHOB|nr:MULTISPECIES: ATP-binding protein [Halocynthiibacter]MCV6824597.1 ATP-binding protein [Halocynthiibacter halioticoli]MCW4057598.1 ATP-binding protein [Halocynthiibacter sp. SDUM655004]
MFFAWLKKFTPRGIYARASLILLLPIVVIQIVVSIIFVQRLYDDVTAQMTNNLSYELRYVVERINEAESEAEAVGVAQDLSQEFGLSILFRDDEEAATSRSFVDLSGRSIIATLEEQFPEGVEVNLSRSWRRVLLWLPTDHGQIRVVFQRSRVSARNPHQLLVLTLSTSILLAIISFIFLRNQMRPIRRLAKASSAFGKGRVVPYRPSGALEVRAAGRAFLDMRHRIERHIEQRTMMLSGVSHDLRSPLTRFKLGLSMLEQSDDVKALEEDVNEMERLLDAFLEFARSDVGEEAVECALLPLVTASIADLRRGGGDVQLVEVRGIEETDMFMLRPVGVRRALDNLLMNALRYGGAAEVSITATERTLRISVEDPGPGIPKADREEALKPFSRLVPARNQNRGSGVGLGLAIAADVARTHGGALKLGRSERLGGLQADLILAR